MSSLLARTGRELQLYEDGFRLVAGCIPYRIRKDVDDQTIELKNRLEVLMISSPDRKDLVFPKGGWENDETVGQAACREALEEAGVKGKLDEKCLGVWEFRSKSRQKLNSCSLEGSCRGYMFALEVTEELDTWPEKDSYRRRWLNVEDASRLCRYNWMREALDKFQKVLSEYRKYQKRNELMEPSAAAPIPEVVLEHQILKKNTRFLKTSNTQRLDEQCKIQCCWRDESSSSSYELPCTLRAEW